MKRLKYLLVILAVLISGSFAVGCSSDSVNNESKEAGKQLDKAELLSALTKIAVENPDGFTVDATTLQPITKGYAVSLAATQNSFGTEGLSRVIDYVTSHSEVNAYGGWLNTDNNQYYYDATVICTSRQEADSLARANAQTAYFDLEKMEEIRL